jgi:hypothetical protein
VAIQWLVHSVALDLLGVSKSENGQALVLPDPLPLGTAPRTAQDNARLWNPDWRNQSTFPLNAAYIDAITDLLLFREKVSQRLILVRARFTCRKAVPSLGFAPTQQEVAKQARQYFKTLRITYRAQTTEAGQRKRQHKNIASYCRGRKKAVSIAIASLASSYSHDFSET